MADRRKKDKTQDARGLTSAENAAAAATAGAFALGVADAVAREDEARAASEEHRIAGENSTADGERHMAVDTGATTAQPIPAQDDSEGAVAAADALAITDPEIASNAQQVADAPLDAETLAARMAEQITAAVGQIAEGVSQGLDAETIGKSIAADIVASVKSMLPAGSETGERPPASLPHVLPEGTPQVVDDVLDRVDGMLGGTKDLAGEISDSVQATLDQTVPDARDILDQVDTMLASTNNLAEDAMAIPATLLGAETEGSAPGLLGTLFYEDGAAANAAPAQIAAAPVAEQASSATDVPDEFPDAFVSDSGLAPAALAGLSYAEIGDAVHDGLHSTTNAFGLL